ncbi:MAG: DUF4254 domain-containing protein [Terracidiphilus sp.]|jgi:hypothetical protein
MLSAEMIVNQQDRETRAWHHSAAGAAWPASAALGEPEANWLRLVSDQHFANFELWHIEDEARVPAASDSEIASVKRRIDPVNQRRNDLAEGLDLALLAWLEPRGLPNPAAALHSESLGMMIDRLSILALKIYHTREEGERADAPAGHAERNRQRLAILEEQRCDLCACVDALWHEILAGTRRFKLYRQLKMYNDPSLNPAVYRNSGQSRQAKVAAG